MTMTLPQIDVLELGALAELAGIHAAPGVYSTILELLALHVSPENVYTLLKEICQNIPQHENTENVKSLSNRTLKSLRNENIK